MSEGERKMDFLVYYCCRRGRGSLGKLTNSISGEDTKRVKSNEIEDLSVAASTYFACPWMLITLMLHVQLLDSL